MPRMLCPQANMVPALVDAVEVAGLNSPWIDTNGVRLGETALRIINELAKDPEGQVWSHFHTNSKSDLHGVVSIPHEP